MNPQPRTKNDERRTNDDVVVSVKNVSKKFCKNLKRSMAYGIADLSKNLMGIKPNSTGLRKDEFWAVDDISFELRRGEVLGLIGANGSGKSTLLRILGGIFPPDKGELIIRGRVSALIAIGAGFHPHMTGRENIYLNGTILGMSHEEIYSKFDDIVDFAEIGDFLDAPISTYSSGMRVRLGFSIAAQTEPDVMLIDEVLAVGDLAFRVKCFEKIEQIKLSGTTILFVSHNTQAIKSLCDRAIYLNRGIIVSIGFPADIIEFYAMDIRSKQKVNFRMSSTVKEKESIGPKKSFAFGTEQGRVVQAIFIESSSNKSVFKVDDIIRLRIDVLFSDSLKNPSLSLIIQDQNLIILGGKYVYMHPRPSEDGLTRTTLIFSFKPSLKIGTYFLTIRLEDRSSDTIFFPIDKQICALSFEILSDKDDQIVGTVDFNIECMDKYHDSLLTGV